jgi:hypothetical protein
MLTRAAVELGRLEVRGQALNVLNAEVDSSGYPDGMSRFLFPIAGRTVRATLVIDWSGRARS